MKTVTLATAEGMFTLECPSRTRSRRFRKDHGSISVRGAFEIQPELAFIFRWSAPPEGAVWLSTKVGASHELVGLVQVFNARGAVAEESDRGWAALDWGKDKTLRIWHSVNPYEDVSISGTNIGEIVVGVCYCTVPS